MFPKPERGTRAKLPTGLRDHYALVAAHHCIACAAPFTQLHHVRGVISPRTLLPLQRRDHEAIAAVTPLCPACHARVDAMNETAFTTAIGRPDGWLLGAAAGFLAASVLRRV